jgi:hypothetical protein
MIINNYRDSLLAGNKILQAFYIQVGAKEKQLATM